MKKIILALITLLALQSCNYFGTVSDSDLHGTWVFDSSVRTITITFNQDNSFVRTEITRDGSMHTDTITGEYSTYYDTLTLKFDYHEKWEYQVIMDYYRDTLNLEGYEGIRYTNRTYVSSP